MCEIMVYIGSIIFGIFNNWYMPPLFQVQLCQVSEIHVMCMCKCNVYPISKVQCKRLLWAIVFIFIVIFYMRPFSQLFQLFIIFLLLVIIFFGFCILWFDLFIHWLLSFHNNELINFYFKQCILSLLFTAW